MKITAISTALFVGIIVVVAVAVPKGQTPQAGAQGERQRQGQAQPAPAFKKLSRADFDALASDPTKVVVVDVRRPDEHQSIGQFPVFLSIQLADLEKYLGYIPKDRAVVTVSNHASRAGRAVALLEKNGFKVAGAIGVQDYEGEGGTVLKIATPAPRAESAAGAAPTGTAVAATSDRGTAR